MIFLLKGNSWWIIGSQTHSRNLSRDDKILKYKKTKSNSDCKMVHCIQLCITKNKI